MLAGSVIVVDGPLGLSIAVGNPSATAGGSDSKVTGPTDEDRTELREVMMENLRREAETKFRAQIAPSDLLLMDSFEVAQILEETFSPSAGEPGKQLTLKLAVEFTAHYVSSEDMKQVSNAALDASIPEGYVAFDTVTYKPLTDPSTDNAGISHFELDVSRTLHRKLDEAQVISLVRGGDPDSAIPLLTSSLPMRRPPEISVSPAWWPWMPLIPFNISIESK